MEAYKRAGRGGAGNYYSPEQIKEATQGGGGDQQQDLEAQKPAVSHVDPPPSDPATAMKVLPPIPSSNGGGLGGGGYARSGRGGAGNFVSAADAEKHQRAEAQHTHNQAATLTRQASYGNAHAVQPYNASSSSSSSQSQQQQIRYSGRGGAGNWTSDPAHQDYEQEQQQRRKAALDAKVFDDVSAGLAAPKKAYQLHPAGHIGRGRVGVAGQGGGGDVDGTDI
ncbi:hypothetical protein PG990_006607 [Apiospora arundinis]|uniref:Uncharacterized protein n=1 Tax=Apiospora arundinis TaxID=335852 RepID=A0ABR2JAX1_9PEZI